MFKKYSILLLFLSGVFHFVKAQEVNKKMKFQSISSVGLLNGSTGTSVALQSIFGVFAHHSFVGVGVGIDYYRFRTIPVFADLRHEFGTGKRNIFLYGDIGYNYDWLTDKNKEVNNLFSRGNNYKGGLYYDAGIGYKIGFKYSDALVLSVGYTLKKVENKVGSGVCPFVGPCYDAFQTYKYYLSRLIIKAGWRF